MYRKFSLFLLISIVVELLVFNHAFIFSLFGSEPRELAFETGDGLSLNADGYYQIEDCSNAYLELLNIKGSLKYLYLDIDYQDENGIYLPFTIRIAIEDEGNSYYYYLPDSISYPLLEKTKYIRIHSYGDILKARIYLQADSDYFFKINSIVYNAKVPCFFSITRMLVLFFILLILWTLRPSSKIYHIQWSIMQKRMALAAVLMANICILGIMVKINTPFQNPPWFHHTQYHQLAVALTEGKVSIETGIEEALSAVPNPYDELLREHFVDVTTGWDTAFYHGKFYVYFGIIPVLIFYLPFYIIFHSAFPTWIGVFLTSSVLLIGIFYLLRQIIQHWFSDTPFILYLLLSFFMGNGIGTIPAVLRPDFYFLPILCALCFTVWGLAFWIRFLELWEAGQPKIRYLAAGSLCMALTAGCRPQFLIGSFLIFPLFYITLKREVKENSKMRRKTLAMRLLPGIAAVILPYLLIAVGLMYYNFIRFESIIDFGATYNITTNDMTHRGMDLGKIPDGIFCYLLQFPNIGLRFPFVYTTSLSSNYIGITIQELMFGGIFFTHLFLCMLFMLGNVRKKLRQKNLYLFTIECLLAGLIIVIADTEMAGLLSRYYTDFLWIFYLPAVLVFLQLWENMCKQKEYKWLVIILLFTGFYGLFMDLGIGIQAGNLKEYNIHGYYVLKSFLP